MKSKFISTMIFDVCRTLTLTNNTHEFIYFVISNNIFKKYLFLFVLFLSNTFSHFHIQGFDNIFRKIQIYFLKGYTLNFLSNRADAYIRLLFKNKFINAHLISVIKNSLELKTDSIILLSSAINFPIISLAKLLGIKSYYATSLLFDKNICTGIIDIDSKDTKLKYLNSLGINFSKSTIYTDNKEDVRIVNMFNNKNVIIFSEDDEVFWETNTSNIKFILFKNIQKDKYNTNQIRINTENWKLAYFPLLYYFLSRLQIQGLLGLLIREVFVVFGFLLTISKMYLFSRYLLFLILFYIVYELGSYLNDTFGLKYEEHPTIRISNKVKFNSFLFYASRLTIFLIIDYLLFYVIRDNYKYILLNSFILATFIIYLFHSTVKKKYRYITFILLRIFKSIIPLMVFDFNYLIIIIGLIIFISSYYRGIYIYTKKVYLNKFIPIEFLIYITLLLFFFNFKLFMLFYILIFIFILQNISLIFSVMLKQLYIQNVKE